MRLNALEIPLLAKKNFVDWSTKLCLYAGPSVAYAFGGKINQDFTEQKVKYTIKESIDFEDMQLKKWDVCLHLEATLAYRLVMENLYSTPATFLAYWTSMVLQKKVRKSTYQRNWTFYRLCISFI